MKKNGKNAANNVTNITAQPTTETSNVAAFWAAMPQEDKDEFLEGGYLSEEAEMELFRQDLDVVDLEIYVDSLANSEVESTQEIAMQDTTPQITEEVVKTVITETPTITEIPKVTEPIQQVQQQQHITQVMQNVTVNVEQPKVEVQPMSIKDKILEAQKIVSIFEKKEVFEDRLKKLYAYSLANKEGDELKLSSKDQKHNFFTTNADMIEVFVKTLETFLKERITETENQIQKIKIA
jgi:hypothetical protein